MRFHENKNKNDKNVKNVVQKILQRQKRVFSLEDNAMRSKRPEQFVLTSSVID